jgi:hypothetical protein
VAFAALRILKHVNKGCKQSSERNIIIQAELNGLNKKKQEKSLGPQVESIEKVLLVE